MKVSGLGVESQPQLPSYTTPTAVPDPRHTSVTYGAACGNTNPLSEAKDRTRSLTDTMSGAQPAEPQWELW